MDIDKERMRINGELAGKAIDEGLDEGVSGQARVNRAGLTSAVGRLALGVALNVPPCCMA